MFVSHVRRAVDQSFLFLVEPRVPEGFDDFVRSAECSATEWIPVSVAALRDVHRPVDFEDLCRYAYGRGFNRGIVDHNDEDWAHASVFVLSRSSPDNRFDVRELRLFTRLIEETRETGLGYFLAELRVMGETHAKRYAPQLV